MTRTGRRPRAEDRTPPPPSAARRTLSDFAIVGAVAVLVSLSGLRNDFAFDDVPLIQTNSRAHDLSQWRDIIGSAYWPPPFHQDLYRPLMSALLALEYAIGHGPLVFRLVSYGLYAVSCMAVLAILARLVRPRVALAIALLFALDPLHVEAVALAVNQAELIVGIAAAAMVWIYLDRRLASRDLSVKDWVGIAVLYAGALMAKETAFIIPAIILAAELILVRGIEARPWKKLVPGYAVIAGVTVAAIALRLIVLGGQFAGATPASTFVGATMGERALTMLTVVPIWLRLFLWPMHLRSDYSPNEIVLSNALGGAEAIGLVLVVLFLVALVTSWKRLPAVAFGLVWCAIALAPVSNVLLPTGVVVGERTLFLPSIGVAIAVAAGIERLIESGRLEAWHLRRAPLVVAVVLGIVWGGRSLSRQLAWKDNFRVWQAMTIDSPKSLRIKEEQSKAVATVTATYEARIAESPAPWQERRDLASMLRSMNADSAAIAQLRLSLQENGTQPDAVVELGQLLLRTGQFAAAKRLADTASRSPATAGALSRIGSIADSALGSRPH